MTRRSLLLGVLATTLAGTASSAPRSTAHPSVYTVRVKTTNGPVAVGEIARGPDGKVVVRALAAPALDKLADDFDAAWKAHVRPPSVAVTENIASDTGMRPSHKDYTFTFKPGDKLYLPAVIKQFAEAKGYEVLGMKSVRFVDYDMTKEYPPGAHDRAAQIINIRKGTRLDDGGGYASFFVQQVVRTPNHGTPMFVQRQSATNPSLAVSQNYDDGTITLAWMKVFASGTVTVQTFHQGQQLVDHWGTYDPKREEEVSIVHAATTWKSYKVKPGTEWHLEGRLVGLLENHYFYDVTPAIDPAVFVP